jgi:hypothetical protein
MRIRPPEPLLWLIRPEMKCRLATPLALRPPSLTPCALCEEAKARAEALRPVLAEMAGKSARAIAAELNAREIATPSGGRWHAETVIRVQRRLEDLS